MKPIVHLTSVHSSFDIRIFHKECKTLVREGYEAVLVVPHEQDAVVDGVRIRAVSSPGSRRERMTHTIWRMYRVALQEDAAVYHLHDPELIPIGLLLKFRGKRIVYDVHEDVPQQVLSKHWIPLHLRSLVSRAARALEAVAARQFHGIVAATDTIARRFRRANGRTVVLHNWPLKREFERLLAAPFSEDRCLVRIGYFGRIAEVRGATVMLDAICRLNQSIPAVLVLAGLFAPERYRTDLEHHPGWKYVDYLGVLDREQVLAQLSRLDIGIDILSPLPRYVVALPTKLFEFMAAGLPCVTANFPMLGSIIDEYRCGLLVDPTDSQQVADAVHWLAYHPIEAQSMGCRGRKAVLTEFCWEEEARRLTSLYESILGEKAG